MYKTIKIKKCIKRPVNVQSFGKMSTIRSIIEAQMCTAPYRYFHIYLN